MPFCQYLTFCLKGSPTPYISSYLSAAADVQNEPQAARRNAYEDERKGRGSRN